MTGMLNSEHLGGFMAPGKVAGSYRYLAWGLAIDSDIPLPELDPGDDTGPADVKIHSGPVPPELPGRTVRGGLFEAGPGSLLLGLDGVARYLVCGGSAITVHPAPDADGDSVRLFLMGSVLGALLQQRDLLVLHGSAIQTPRGAVIFAGESGIGKSALAGAFHARGYPLMTDEISAIRSHPTGAELIPSCPRLLLWPDVMELLNLGNDGVRPARANLKKLHVPLEKGFSRVSAPLHAVYILHVTNGREFEVSPITGFDGVQELIAVTFRRSFLTAMCPDNSWFQQLTALAGRVRISRLYRPAGRSLRETADFLEKDFSR
jgi:hypothetical protein